MEANAEATSTYCLVLGTRFRTAASTMLQFRIFKRERLTAGLYAELEHRVQSQATEDADDPYERKLNSDDRDGTLVRLG